MINMTHLVSKACANTATLFDSVQDSQLDGRTPCERLPLRELVAHLGTLGVAFAAAARKDFGELTDSPPGTGGYQLDDGWRVLYPDNVVSLATAWNDPSAWEGMTRVGGMDLPAEVCGMIALTEVVIHGWDVAVATGQDYEVDPDVAEAVLGHLSAFAADGPVEGLFDAAIEIPSDATAFDRALGLSGRDPAWRA